MYHQEELAPVVKFSDWMIALVITAIPVLNFIMLIVWAMETGGNPNRVNWAKACLVVMCLQIVAGFFIMGAFMGAISHFMGGLSQFNQLSTW